MSKAGRPTVLLVDDYEDIAELIAYALEMAGFKVLSASTGREALEIFERDHPTIDVALVDLGLPDISGREVVARMGEIDEHTPIVATSGSHHERMAMALEAGAADFLAKPFDLTTLPDLLAKAISRQPSPELI